MSLFSICKPREHLALSVVEKNQTLVYFEHFIENFEHRSTSGAKTYLWDIKREKFVAEYLSEKKLGYNMLKTVYEKYINQMNKRIVEVVEKR